MPISAARAITCGSLASRTDTSTGPDANSTVSEISASACSSSLSTTTNARSGSSRAISSIASPTETANGVTSCPSVSSTSPRALRSSSRSLASRILKPRSLVVDVIRSTLVRSGRVPRRTLRLRPCNLAPFSVWSLGLQDVDDRAYPQDTWNRTERVRNDRRLLERARPADQPARPALVERFLPLARQLARRYQRGGELLDDLNQVASLGLLKAIDRFDPSRATAFSSFAVPTILGELKRHFRDKGWSVRVPRDLQELAVRLEPTNEALSREIGRVPTTAELAERLGVSVEQVLEAREAAGAYRAVSLDRPREDDEEGDGIGAGFGIEDAGFAEAEDAATVQHLMRVLTDREREVLRLRFEEDLTQAEIGTRIGVSQMHVSRIIRQAIAQLQRAAEE